MKAHLLPLYVLCALWVLWYLYIIVMGLYRAKLQHRLTTASLVLGAPVIVLGATLDWALNWTVATVFFREWPRAPAELVTQRLTRYLKDPSPDYNTRIRRHRAGIICRHLLDPFDPSTKGHCDD